MTTKIALNLLGRLESGIPKYDDPIVKSPLETMSNSLSKPNTKMKISPLETRTITMSYDNFENAITSFLYSIGEIPDNMEVIWTDFGVELNPDGLVEFEITLQDERQLALNLGDPLGR